MIRFLFFFLFTFYKVLSRTYIIIPQTQLGLAYQLEGAFIFLLVVTRAPIHAQGQGSMLTHIQYYIGSKSKQKRVSILFKQNWGKEIIKR